MPSDEGRTNEQLRAELAAERAALKAAIGDAREELKRSAKLAGAVPLALAGARLVAKRLFGRRHRS